MDRRVLWVLLLLIPATFLDRFAYYGSRAILFPWLTGELAADVEQARSTMTLFTTVTYSMPLVGALIAIGIGPRFTLSFGALIATFGYLLLAIAPSMIAARIALVTLAAGSGIMKPCIVAALADALPDPRESARNAAFATFYLAINAAALFSTMIMPLLYSNGFQRGTFGVSAALAFLATILTLGAALAWRFDRPRSLAPAEPFGVNEWWKPLVGAVALGVFSIPMLLSLDIAASLPYQAGAGKTAQMAAWNPAIVAPVAFLLAGALLGCAVTGVRVRGVLLIGIGFVIIAAGAAPVAIAPASFAAVAASVVIIGFGEVFGSGMLSARAVAGHHWRVKPLVAALVMLGVTAANAGHGITSWFDSSDRLFADRFLLSGAILFTGGLGLALAIAHRPLSRFFWPDPASTDLEAAHQFD